MRDVRQIARFWRENNSSVLTTLVGAEGSSYRQPGARLLLGTDGTWVGTISGGCLESAVVQKGRWNVRNGAVVERYSTVFDDMSDMPFGSGCGGIVDLLMEPTDTPECRALMGAIEASLRGEESTILTWLPTKDRTMARAVLSPTGEVLFRSDRLIREEIKSARDLPAGTIFGGVFAERLKAPQRLFVMGAGDDAKPVTSIAALLGWSVIVMDGRSHLARAARFPDADVVRVISSPELAVEEIQENDAVVLMTHSFEQDRHLLAALLPIRPKYLGLLGARRRSSLLVSEVAATLGRSLGECCEQVYAPIGLDLGGDGAEAIALAVVAEIQACCMGKLPSSRRLSPIDISRYGTIAGQAAGQTVQCSLDVA